MSLQKMRQQMLDLCVELGFKPDYAKHLSGNFVQSWSVEPSVDIASFLARERESFPDQHPNIEPAVVEEPIVKLISSWSNP